MGRTPRSLYGKKRMAPSAGTAMLATCATAFRSLSA